MIYFQKRAWKYIKMIKQSKWVAFMNLRAFLKGKYENLNFMDNSKSLSHSWFCSLCFFLSLQFLVYVCFVWCRLIDVAVKTKERKRRAIFLLPVYFVFLYFSCECVVHIIVEKKMPPQINEHISLICNRIMPELNLVSRPLWAL